MIAQKTISEVAEKLYKNAVLYLPKDVENALRRYAELETNHSSRGVLSAIIHNIETARNTPTQICMDSGVTVHFIKMGSGVELEGSLNQGMADGVASATKNLLLRPSVVHPITRNNTGNNVNDRVPLLHINLIDGADYMEIITVPKGFGSENMSRLAMLTPGEGVGGVKKFVLETMVLAGGKPCPPVIVGVGIGGTFDYVARLAKEAAAIREVGSRNPDPEISQMEEELLEAINSLGIGPMGLGGKTTALDLHVEVAGTHIACIPVAVNFQCWPARRAAARISADGEVTYL